MKFEAFGAAWIAALVLAGGSPARADTIEEKAAVCMACHGDKGIPIDTKIPVLFGQNEGYIYTELKDMKKGARNNEVMTPIVQDMSRDEMLAYAAYFSAKTWTNLVQTRATAADSQKFDAINASAGCTGCHQGSYLGAGTQPRLAGQNYDYLVKTMFEFRNGARANNAWMKDLLNTYKDDDIQLMARVLAGK
jgi:cytochrome c553